MSISYAVTNQGQQRVMYSGYGHDVPSLITCLRDAKIFFTNTLISRPTFSSIHSHTFTLTEPKVQHHLSLDIVSCLI